MVVPFRRARKPKEKARDLFRGIADKARHARRKIPGRKYAAYYLRVKAGKAKRHIRYAAEDFVFEVRRLSRHSELMLFGALVVLAAAMMVSSGGESVLNSLMALLMLALLVVVYTQVRMQKKLLRQYVPTIEFVRIRKSELSSDRVRLVNLYGAREKLARMKLVRNIRIRYDVINDSFAPLSIEGAGLTLKMKGDRKLTLPPAVSILDVEPKRTSGTDVEFRLKETVSFDSIEWMELDLRGNCRKRIRVVPHLYVDVVLREKVPKFIYEPFGKFAKRPELLDESVMPESK